VIFQNHATYVSVIAIWLPSCSLFIFQRKIIRTKFCKPSLACSIFFRRKYNRGRYRDSQWVFGGIERDTKNFFLVCLPNRARDTLLEIINKRTLPGTIIISDKWKAYDTINYRGSRERRVRRKIRKLKFQFF